MSSRTEGRPGSDSTRQAASSAGGLLGASRRVALRAARQPADSNRREQSQAQERQHQLGNEDHLRADQIGGGGGRVIVESQGRAKRVDRQREAEERTSRHADIRRR